MNTTVSILLLSMVLNGQPVGEPLRLRALNDDCRAELAMIEGVNRSQSGTGIVWRASCVAISDVGQDRRR